MTIATLPTLRVTAPAIALALASIVLLIIGAALLAGHLAEDKLVRDLQRRLDSNLDVLTSGLVGDLADYPATLTMLSSDPPIQRAIALRRPDDIATASERLRQYADLTGIDNAMIVDGDGRLIVDYEDTPTEASSVVTWLMRQPAFDTALKSGLGRAFGIVDSGVERRYVFARRIHYQDYDPALLIIAINLDHTELFWRLAGQNILVVDQGGVVILSSDPARPFEQLGAYPEMREEESSVNNCRQGTIVDTNDQICRASSIVQLGWDIHLVEDMAPVRDQIRLIQWVTVLALLSLALLLGVIAQRRFTVQRTLRFKEDANRHLQKRVDRRTSELEATNDRLKSEIEERITKEDALRKAQAELVQTSKLAALGQLSAGIAHELNQPLAALRAYADNARILLARGRTDTALENLTLIGDLTERMAKITRDLKVLARRQPVKTEPVALPPLVQSVVDQIGKTGALDVIDLHNDIDPLILIAEPIGLQQVLVNLLQNAIDSLEQIPAPGHREIRLASLLRDDRGLITITDNGPGIAPAIMESIFDPFFTTKEVGKGLGLGLSLSASIIQEMGGQLSADDLPDGGARFSIELKLAASEPDDQEHAAS